MAKCRVLLLLGQDIDNLPESVVRGQRYNEESKDIAR